MTAAPPPRLASRFASGPLIVALLAGALVIGTIDPAGSYPETAQGPGITLDEVFNVEMGVYQWDALRTHGWKLWTPPVREQVFADGPGAPYNPDHPPLGRLWLGIAHNVVRAMYPPVETGAATVTACARVGSALAFAFTVLLIGWCADRWFGRTAGWAASLAMLLMPRLFAHAHLAALETVMNCAFAATILYVADRCGAITSTAECPARPRMGTATIAGLLFGFALLTKLQAVLLPVPIAIFILWQYRLRGIGWLLLFAGTGVATFLLGWPWLWIDPLEHGRDYFARGIERQTLYCFYLGERFSDADVPWHYPWVMFAVTVPVGIHALALLGGLHRSARTFFLSGTILFVLLFFSRPGGHLYDGARLFLVVFPLWALLAGAGAQWLRDACERFRFVPKPIVSYLLIVALLAAESYALFTLHPCQLSYYNLGVGSLRGAARYGMEVSYWQDSLTREFQQDLVRSVPQGATIDLAPRLHPIQEVDLLLQSPILTAHQIQLRAYDDKQPHTIRYVIVFRRRADPWPSLEPAPPNATLLAQVRRDGVQLAALYELH